MTGAGGGALMTPMLILLFGVSPGSAISSDLVAAVVMRPFGAAVHIRARTVNLKLVRWMVIGSVPAAFLGAYLLRLMGNSKAAETNIQIALGAALLVRRVRDGDPVRARSSRRAPAQRRDRRASGQAARDGRDRRHRWPDRRDDLGRLGLADDRAARCSCTR